MQAVKQKRFKCVINFEVRAAYTLQMKECRVGWWQAAVFLGGHRDLIRCHPLYWAVWSVFSFLFSLNPSFFLSPSLAFFPSISGEGDAGCQQYLSPW